MINSMALARRFRPRNFQSVVGQAVTLQALSNALESGRIHHAYLFTGMRGIGKTTLARILAKCLNCETGITNNPCGTCSSCKAIDEGSSVDVLEVDAASRTRVEDTREILENVQYLPTQSRFKIYLIDEVHMLSMHSFNALLKTLEEPPSHVKFILATTDPQKLPVTILSRCLKFHLHPHSFSDIVSLLKQVLKEEGITFEQEALEDIARVSEGALRDSLSLLEQAIAYGKNTISAQDVKQMLGLADATHVLALIRAIFEQNTQQVLDLCRTLAEKSQDFTAVLSELLIALRHIAMAQTNPASLEESVSRKSELLTLASLLSEEEVQLYYQIGVLGQRDLPYAPTPRIGFEMTILRMLAFQPLSPNPGNAHSNDKKVEAKWETKKSDTKDKVNVKVEAKLETKKSDHEKSDDWSLIVPKLNLLGITKELASHCTMLEKQEDFIHLVLEESQRPLLQKRHEETLLKALNTYFSKEIRLKISVGQGAKTINTPAGQQKMALLASKQEAQGLLEQDPKLSDIIQTFDAKIEEIVVEKA